MISFKFVNIKLGVYIKARKLAKKKHEKIYIFLIIRLKDLCFQCFQKWKNYWFMV